ncbi:MAG: ABC transporter permease [Flavobacteriales bacterium]|nr:ABC transporter permease [Flavobacteriales bacterium]MBK9286936.1 ABC transporter permease [Flavobacteriales bacterium]
MNKIKLIIWREFITRVRKPSFLIMTILGPLLIAGGVAAVTFLGLQESGPQSVLVVDVPHLFTDKLANATKPDITFHYRADDISDSAFKNSTYTLMVRMNEEVLKNNQVEIFYTKVPSQSVQNYISAEVEKVLRKEKLRINNLDENVFDQVGSPVAMKLIDIEKGDESLEQEKAAIGFFLGYIMLLFIMLYGMQVMRGVMEEKQSRIIEVLASSVRPFQLMMGKIVGIAMVGLVQFLLWIILSTALTTGVIALAKDRLVAQVSNGIPMDQPMTTETKALLQNEIAKDNADMSQGLDKVHKIIDQTPITLVIILFLFYFLCGYLLYSSFFAAIGAAVDSETDTQQFMLPAMLPLMLALFIAQMAIVNPDGPAVFWFSIVPFTSPIVMMVRIAMGNAFEHPWELILSMVLLVATFIGTTWLAGRIYRTGILMYGKKVTWKELGKWLFYKG